jgi:hypothetical protein
MEKVTKNEMKELALILKKENAGDSLYYCKEDNKVYIWQGTSFVALKV